MNTGIGWARRLLKAEATFALGRWRLFKKVPSCVNPNPL
jgi:hypothetical protein